MKAVGSPEMKLYALDRRREGKGWAEIRRLIRDKFYFDPLPSRRTMQRWDHLNYGKLEAKLTDNAEKQAKIEKDSDAIEVAEAKLHNLWRYRRLKPAVEYREWESFFILLESILGTEKFLSIIDAYLSDRKRSPDFPPSLDD